MVQLPLNHRAQPLMQPRLERTVLLPRAFAHAPLPVIDPAWVTNNLYNNNPPEYAEAVSKGTVENFNTFNQEEKIVIERFNNQFEQIIEFIKTECVRLQVSDHLTSTAPDGSEDKIDLSDELNTFYERYSGRVYYLGEQASFYTQIKRSLEIIAYNLRENSALHNTDKKRLLEHLISEIRYCAGGVFQHIETAKIELSSHETLDVWLAKFRLMLIQQYAQGNPHAEFVYLKHAIELGWNPYGFETQSAVYDTFSKTDLLKFRTKDQFAKYFLKKYTPTAIMETLATGLYRCITEKLKDNNAVICFEALSDFQGFFLGIPFITEEKINIYDIFSTEPSSADSPILFKFADECFYQKPISELMQSMTGIFADTDSGFFKIYRDEYYILVPQSPYLCYQHNSEKQPPLEATQKALTWLLIDNKTALNYKLFLLFYNKGIQNFSDNRIIFSKKLEKNAVRVALQKNKPEHALALLSTSPYTNENFRKLYKLIKNRAFESRVNNLFLDFFHSTLQKDNHTPEETKEIITDHFITILQENNEKNNNQLLIEICNSRKNLEDKLNGNPMSIFLKAAFEIFFVAAIVCLPPIIAGCSAGVVLLLLGGVCITSAPCTLFAARDAYRHYTQKKQETDHLIDSVFVPMSI